MSYLKIWHKKKHDDGTVSEIHNFTPAMIIDRGGFFEPKSKAFILLHNINWIEVIEEPAPPSGEESNK